MAEDESRIEFGSRHEHSEHDLPDEPRDDQPDPLEELGPHFSSCEPRTDHRNDGKSRDDPVAEFDRRVKAGRVEFVVHGAVGPVGAAEPGTRQSHSRSAHGDDHEPDQGDLGPEAQAVHVNNDTARDLGRNTQRSVR